MNWLLFLEVGFSGVCAGLLTWLIAPAGHPWNLVENFQTGLLNTGIFSGIFIGLAVALPVLFKEKRNAKAVSYSISAASVGLAVNMLGAVVFAIFTEVVSALVVIPAVFLRFFWWLSFSICLAGSFGILYGNFKTFCRSLMGLTPAFVVAGAFVDRVFLINDQLLISMLFLGGSVGFGLAISWELLKESWLDEDGGKFSLFRYYLDSPAFIVGSSDECDLTLQEGPENLFCIYEKDGLHVVESMDDATILKINNGRFRYRVLVDGDSIVAGDRVFVYHTRLARSRDIMPEAAA